MAIDRDDIVKLSKLARIAISEEDVDEVTGRLSKVLEFIDQLQSADVDGVEPMAHPLDAVQVLRADAVTEVDRREDFQKHAPAAEQGLFLVPKVID